MEEFRLTFSCRHVERKHRSLRHLRKWFNESAPHTQGFFFFQYYDEDNITASKLAFRVAVGQPPYHEQYDTQCMKTLYNIVACVYFFVQFRMMTFGQ